MQKKTAPCAGAVFIPAFGKSQSHEPAPFRRGNHSNCHANAIHLFYNAHMEKTYLFYKLRKMVTLFEI